MCDKIGHMAMECPQFWRIEGNVKRHLCRLKSINNLNVEKTDSEHLENQQRKSKIKKMNSRALKNQEIEDEEIRQMIKHNLEFGGTEDILEIIKK